MTVSLGDVALPEGLEPVDGDLTVATDVTTGEPVDIECFPVVVNPGGLEPGSSGEAEVGTHFVVDVACRPYE